MERENYTNTIVIDNRDMEPPELTGDIYEVRQKYTAAFLPSDAPMCSIIVLGYNRLDKTKYSVECILKYAGDISYELILVDNGSESGVLEFFQSVPYENKTIIRIEKNIGATFAIMTAWKACKGKYIFSVSNDVYLTENALSNLIYCLESDPAIGAVTPMSSNASNRQQVDLEYKNFGEMQKKAAAFNKRDPSKWEERIRLVSILWIAKREIVDIVGTGDPAYIHEYAEDDIAVRIRRAGYKQILCGDTWVCHDHDVRNKGKDDHGKLKEILTRGREVYRQKYYGIDAQDDTMMDAADFNAVLEDAQLNPEGVAILCANVRCGLPVFSIRSILKKRGIENIYCSGFTTDAKYYLDLQTICNDVHSDRMDFIQDYYANGTFDIVTCGEPVNMYPSPFMLIQKLYDFLKPGGILIIKVRNADDYNSFLRTIGIKDFAKSDRPSCMAYSEATQCIRLLGGEDIRIFAEEHQLTISDKQQIVPLLKSVKPNASEDDFNHLITKSYTIKAVKG